jgi:propionate catabolism operon transcriptional regulator
MAIPALRDRRDDIASLAEWFLKNALAEMGVRPNANLHAECQACSGLLQAWHWPGNVRELRNLMQRVALLLSVEPLQALTPAFLAQVAPEIGRAMADDTAVTDLPQEDLAAVLRRFDGNRAAAATHLGISRTTLWRRLKSGG